MEFAKASLVILILDFFVLGCAEVNTYKPSGYSERDVAGVTWLFPEIQGYRSMEGMSLEEYQQVISSSYLIEMSPVYAYYNESGTCRNSLVFSVKSKFSGEAQSEFEFIQKSPSGVRELIIEGKSDKKYKVLYVIYSVKHHGVQTRVVLVHFKERIVGFEMRPVTNCRKPDDYELLEFVRKFIELNVK